MNRFKFPAVKPRTMHVITFIKKVKKFTAEEGITSWLKVDKDNSVEDVLDITLTGGIIAGMDNDVGELIDVLHEYYTKTNNKKMLKRLEKVS